MQQDVVENNVERAVRSGRRFSAIAMGLAMLGALLAFVPATASPAEAANPARVGAYARNTGNGYQSAIDVLERKIGRDFSSVRRFLWWNSNLSNDTVMNTAVDNGVIPLVSIRPNQAGGAKIPWADIANAPEGSALDNNMERLGAELASFDGTVWFSFHHEPEAQVNLPHGSSEDFKAAWRRVVTEIRGQGATNVEFVLVTTTYAFRVGSNDRRYGPKWFPGASYVDHFAADAYNWGDCRPNIDQVEPWEAITGPWLAFTANYPNKGIIIAEFGTVEDANDPNAKAEWITDMRRDLREPKWGQLEAVLAFNSEHTNEYPACDWYLDTSPQSLAAAKALFNDPLFGGNEPAPPAAPELCTVTPGAGRSATINIVNQPGNDVLLRNGVFLASMGPNVSRYFDNDSSNATYVLRVWYNGSAVDYPCHYQGGAVTASCSVNVSGANGARISWDNVDGNVVIRRNNTWLTTPGVGENGSYTDTNLAPGTYKYVVRAWIAGNPTDIQCGALTIGDGAGKVCVATGWANGNEIVWRDQPGDEVVRRNNAWFSTPPKADTTDWDPVTRAGSYTYVLRVWHNGSYVDHPCGTINR